MALPSHPPLIAELTGEAVEVVDVLLGPHDHLKGRDELAAGCTVPRHTKQPVGPKKKRQLSTPLPQPPLKHLTSSLRKGEQDIGAACRTLIPPFIRDSWLLFLCE